jgi:cysteine-rich repeat protein
MRKLQHMVGVGLAVVTLGITATVAVAAPSPAAKCRKALGKAGVGAVKAGLKALDKCHTRRDKGSFNGDCNTVPSAQSKLAGAVQKACGKATEVPPLFTGGDIAGQIAGAIQSNLAASGSELQGAPSLNGDKAMIKCHAAIGKGRSGIVNAIVRGATGCQKQIDKSATTFGPLAEQCVLGAGAAGSKASGKISRACGGVAGTDVGSCASLPDCVITAATATGQTTARGLYSSAGGGVPECHNGRVEEGEVCDPGLFDTDTCVNCQPAGCGDGTTTGSEECDDGNTTAGDGCSPTCTVETPPGGSLVNLVVALTHDPAFTGDVAGVEITVDYAPAKVSIPGTGNVPAAEGRVQNLGPDDVLFSVSDRDTNADAQDDQLFIPYGTAGTLPPGDIVRVILDGAAGASISDADFTCTVQTAVDSAGTPLGGVTCAVTVTVTNGTTTTTTGSVTTTTATTTSTTSTT